MGEHFTQRPVAYSAGRSRQPMAARQSRERESPAPGAKRARVRGSSGRPRFVVGVAQSLAGHGCAGVVAFDGPAWFCC
jgi:hypothetical protein